MRPAQGSSCGVFPGGVVVGDAGDIRCEVCECGAELGRLQNGEADADQEQPSGHRAVAIGSRVHNARITGLCDDRPPGRLDVRLAGGRERE